VKGRVFLYDDATKTLILKLWSDELRQYTGMAVYNAANVQLESIHALQDLTDDFPLAQGAGGFQEQEEAEHEILTREFSCAEDGYSKIAMDRLERFSKEQIQKRKEILDEKYGTSKQENGSTP